MQEFLTYIPHRPPFLFVDEVIESADGSIKTRKTVKPEEPFFEGHFPGRPIMPGVLILESVFQAGAILMAKRQKQPDNRIPVITRINNVKIKHAVLPGDVMDIEVTLKEMAEPACYLSGRVSVSAKRVLTVEFAAMLVEEVK